jgi:adenylate cyclase
LPDEVARDTTIEIGVGINTGPACVGNVGSAERFNYSAIGDAVNVAARAEAACKELGYDLVICRSTAEQAEDFAVVDAGGVLLKGKSERVPLMILIGDKAMKSSTQFEAFAHRYEVLIDRLRDHGSPFPEDSLADCRRLAKDLDHGLLRFLDRLRSRREDFPALSSRRDEIFAAD